jgi:hypothetical protein
MSAVRVRICDAAVDNPFPPKHAAACHDRFLRWQQCFVFTAQADLLVEEAEFLTYPHKETALG